jgi:hypothetical protein
MKTACQLEGLSPDNFYSALIQDQIAYHDFEGVTVRGDEKLRLVRPTSPARLPRWRCPMPSGTRWKPRTAAATCSRSGAG